MRRRDEILDVPLNALAHMILGRIVSQDDLSDQEAAHAHLENALQLAEQMHSPPFQAQSAFMLSEVLSHRPTD